MSGLEFLLLAGFFLTVVAGIAGAGWVLVVGPSARRADDPLEALAGPLPERGAAFVRAFRAIGEAVPVRTTKRADPVRKLLIAAGYRWPAALTIYTGVTYASGFFFALLAAWWSFLSQSDASLMLTAAIAGGGLGYLMPNRLLESLARRRAGRLREAIPVGLDLLVLSIEAGQSLDYALADAARELKFAYPDLAQELAAVSLELRSASDRAQVFRDLGKRNSEPELTKLAALFMDSDRFGTPLGPTLRTQARYMRTRRRQLAQEHARRIGVKLIFPVFFLIFPCVLLVTVGPAVINIFEALRDMAR